MHYLVIALIFAISVYQTIRRGPAAAFVYVFLPVLLGFAIVKPIAITAVPDITSPMAVSYGVLLGMLISGCAPAIKIHPVDVLIVLMSISVVMTGFKNGVFWTLISQTGTEVLRWLVPYYLARLAFREAILRRHIAIVLAFTAMALAAVSLVEWRLWPLFFSRQLENFGLSQAHNTLVLGRFGFFRAMVTAEHPIDFGNVGIVLAGMIPAMAVCGGVALRDWRILAGIAGATTIVVTSMSFSSYLGFMAGIAIFATLRYVRSSELLLVPGMLAAFIAGFLFTQHLLSVDVEALRPTDDGAAALDGSYYIRALIVQRSWENIAQHAGFFGFGDQNISKEELGLESVDNSYMLFLMRRGWVHSVMRLMLGLTIAWLGMKMLRHGRGIAGRLPAAACTAALMGTMVSMYTVWFGFVYAVLWTCLLGLFVTMRQVMQEHAALDRRAGEPLASRAHRQPLRAASPPLAARAARPG